MYRKKLPSKLREPDSVEHGYNYAIFLLGLRLYTEGEVREKMQNRGYSTHVITEVLNRLVVNKYIDDERFAEMMIDNFKRYKTYGLFMVKKKMMEKRLPRELIDTSLERFFSPDEELEVATRYAVKEGLSVHEGMDYTARQKIAYKLGSRGFRSEIVSKILSGYVPEE